WTYKGDTPLIGQIGLGNFSALSTKPESNVSTDFVSRTHVEDPNGEVREEDNITHTKAPSGTDLPPPVEPPVEPPVDPPVVQPPSGVPSGVPEPASFVLLALSIPLVPRARILRQRREGGLGWTNCRQWTLRGGAIGSPAFFFPGQTSA